jgi:DNA gyrase subunit A
MERGVQPIIIEEEMRGAYLDYAMSVITARALPDVRDGLKPVQRRILYTMDEMGLRHTAAYKKSARIVGDVLGKLHPHGDMAVYEAMVRMAQDFSMRYVLVDGQGNFGSIDGDPPAAMRYSEVRLTAIAEEMLLDIDKNTVDFTDNFDATLKEPAVLPAKLPNLLVNGSSGIAVGMATNIPPHNLGEVCDALAYLIDHYKDIDEVELDDLMAHIKGPDFPTGGIILGLEGLRNAYATGTGRVVVRAKMHTEEIGGGRERIIVTELPYQVNKAALIEKIADLVRSKRIDTISDLRDESDRRGMSIVIELKRGADARITLNQLLKYTPLQSAFSVNMLALVDGEPRVLPIKRMLQLYIEHRQVVLTRRSQFELERARARAHILEGLRIALSHLDAVIALIRRARDADAAKQGLMKRFKLSEIQAQAILDMPLRRLAALERKKIDEEYAEAKKSIAHLADLLKHPKKILELIKQELADIKTRYGDARRTQLLAKEIEELREEDLIPEQDVLISLTQRGYVKRMPVELSRPRTRGGRGAIGVTTREEDAVLYLLAANTRDNVFFFSNRGRVFQQKAYQLPEGEREAKGLPLSNLIALDSGERVTAALAVPDVKREGEALEGYLVMATVGGKVKRTTLSEFASVRAGGLVAMTLDEGDELGWAKLTQGEQEIILVSESGQAIRFREDEVRPQGRVAGGVMAIRLAKEDRVASMDIVQPKGALLVVTEHGFGKRTPLEEFPLQGRHGGGVRAIDKAKLAQTGRTVTARVVLEDDEVAIISADGVMLRTNVRNIPKLGRDTWGTLVRKGETLIKLKEKDTVASLARLSESPTEASPGPMAQSVPVKSTRKGKKA